MEYSVNKLSKMSGISARTLRYYDEIGLLIPARVAESGYRIYGQAQVDLLQQILFYKELGFALDEIKELLQNPDFSEERAFSEHLAALQNQRERLNRLILNVEKSLAAMKGEIFMSNQEKFEGFKRELIDENERKYGAEIREKYGDEAAEASNAHLMGMSQEQYDEGESLRAACEDALKNALATGDPAGEAAQNAADLHRRWLSFYAPNYSKEYHKGLGEMYVADERFRAYYDKIAPGCAEFLREAINIYAS
ncbi:MAG: MerR family transcriptional regulator [Clostridiales bacterium]|jgi:DNA-binding transcriptional MerR regulator|nr:MerR family transcriptional regulator [Clostridiales bacterium]